MTVIPNTPLLRDILFNPIYIEKLLRNINFKF